MYNSFSKLYKIVRISNFAFFSENWIVAYQMIDEALTLYRKIGDKKAIGIACNNLGNTLHAMWSSARVIESNSLDDGRPLDCCDQIQGICIVQLAKTRYDEAIAISREQLELATSDEEKANFTVHLADRIFNRALFLLLVSGERCAPNNAREIALSDIGSTRQMDLDVEEFWLDRKILLDQSAEHFLRLLRRCSGLLDFYHDEELRGIWNPSDLVKDADCLLFAAWDQPSAALFKEISRIGRLQQLECVAMRLDICRGCQILAARLAMRMFAEDEYLLEPSFAASASVFVKLIREEENWPEGWTSKTNTVRTDLRKMLLTCKDTSLDIGKCLVFAVEISDKWRGHPLLESLNGLCLQLYDECCLKDDTMGLVAIPTQGDFNVPICIKAENEGRQRTSLDLATSTTTPVISPAFPFALQMLIDSNSSPENDAFIILFTDGYSWDSTTPTTFHDQIKRMNRSRETKLRIVILGIEIESEAVKTQCRFMCSLTKQSIYIDINENNIDQTFYEISTLIRGERTTTSLCSQGITVEKF